MSGDHDLLVIGAGPAGLSAGLYGTRLGLRAALMGEVLGGMAAEAWVVENYPGVDRIRGIELVEKMQRQAETAGLEMIVPKRVERLELADDKVRALTSSDSFESEALVLATGCCHRVLGVPGEEEFRGRGVSYCAVCDGVFFKGKNVAVVGGGNTAAMEALYLKEIAGKVYMVHRRNDLRADAKLKREVLDGGIEVLWNKEVEEIRGENLVDSLLVRDTAGGEETSLDVAGVFIAVGEDPQSQLGRDIGVRTTPDGFIEVNRRQETTVKGVYAAGDVTGGVHQIGVAVGEGITAAVNAYLYIKGGWYGEGRKEK
ncbi:MAG: NAD(P)/FAD-dependent oxidoreductase [Thermodesulfobacteriota bacterium]